MSRLRLLSFNSALLFSPKVVVVVQRELLIVVVQQLEAVFSIVSKDLRALFNISGPGTNTYMRKEVGGLLYFKLGF
jgi:hypothetical protein